MLLHLVDATQEDPAEAYRVVRGELEAYGAGLDEKPEVVALSKADALPPDEIEKKKKALARVAGKTPVVLSSASGAGVEGALRVLWRIIEEGRTSDPNDVPSRKAESWTP